MLEVTGDATIEGSIIFQFIDNFAPQQGDTFEFLSTLGSADFSSASLVVENLLPDFEFDIEPFSGGLRMTALTNGTFVPEPSSLILLALATPLAAWRGRII